MTDTTCSFCVLDDPAVTVWADAHAQAVVSRRPINGYHVIIVPRAHVEQLPDVPQATAASVWAAAAHVARAIATVAHPDGITYVTEDDLTGQGYNLVAHWKLHVIARFRDDAVRLEWGREPDLGEAARADIAAALRTNIANIARDV
jgi:histidine triad (HIT) family protein